MQRRGRREGGENADGTEYLCRLEMKLILSSPGKDNILAIRVI
jgi:hypothetical protein